MSAHAIAKPHGRKTPVVDTWDCLPIRNALAANSGAGAFIRAAARADRAASRGGPTWARAVRASMKCARSNATCHRTLSVTGAADLVDLPRADKREFRYHIGCLRYSPSANICPGPTASARLELPSRVLNMLCASDQRFLRSSSRAPRDHACYASSTPPPPHLFLRHLGTYALLSVMRNIHHKLRALVFRRHFEEGASPIPRSAPADPGSRREPCPVMRPGLLRLGEWLLSASRRRRSSLRPAQSF